MPTLTIHTNILKATIPDAFASDLSALVANLVGKPEKYVCVHVVPDQMMTFEGSSGPCASCSLYCIGKMGTEENKMHTAALMEKINRELKIPVDRMYINFFNMERENVGWNGKTFAS